MRSHMSVHDAPEDRQRSLPIMALAALTPPDGWIFQAGGGTDLPCPPVMGANRTAEQVVDALSGWLTARSVTYGAVRISVDRTKVIVYGPTSSTDSSQPPTAWTEPFPVPARLIQRGWAIPSSTPGGWDVASDITTLQGQGHVTHHDPSGLLDGSVSYRPDAPTVVRVPTADGWTPRIALRGAILGDTCCMRPGWRVLHLGRMAEVLEIGTCSTTGCLGAVSVVDPDELSWQARFCLQASVVYTVQVPAGRGWTL
jgi:hypothetical protein